MADRPDMGVPASPSGHSASPEPAVSALRASVPNAELSEHLRAVAESELVMDVGKHIADRVFEVVKGHAMTMPTVSAAIGVGLVAMQQIYAETVQFAANSMDGERSDEALIRVSALGLAHELIEAATDFAAIDAAHASAIEARSVETPQEESNGK